MAEIWRERDRLNRDVIFDSVTRDHILREHDEMAGRLHEVRTAIENPEVVTRDTQFRRRENHYTRATAGRNGIKVVVNYRPVPPQGTWIGERVTAYPVDKPKPGEEQLYP